MLGLAGLIDNLLTAKLSPPLDVLALQREAGVAAPGAVRPAGTVNNDVRLPSNAALDRLLPGAPAVPSPATPPGRASAQADLSLAARAISVVLAQLHGDAGPVRSAAPAWPTTQAPLPAMLANALAQVVSDSGLFYESHLAQFAEGTRTAAQLLREPQARWGGAPPPMEAAAAPPQGVRMATAAVAVADAVAVAVADASPQGAHPVNAAAAGASPDASQGVPSDASPDTPPDTPDGDVARMQAAYRRGEAGAGAMPESPTTDARAATGGAGGGAAAAGATAGPVIHPQGMTLVHQQLDLLATEAFRWSGQAWPGAPMAWSIEAQPDARDGAAPQEESQRTWTTTVSMTLPHLGAVDIRLSLAGQGLQARLSAGEAATATRLRAQGGALTERMAAAGLHLNDFQVAAKGPA